MKRIKKKLSKILLSLTMVFAMLLTIMPTNVFAATYPEPDITVNYAENMEAIEIPADKSTTIKVIFDEEYEFLNAADWIFSQTPFGEANVNYGLAVNLSPKSANIGDEKNLHFVAYDIDFNETNFYIPVKVVAGTTDAEKLAEAKPLAETAITGITATNTTTAKNILDAVTAGISSVDGVTASWKSAPTITPATKENAGSITGTIVLTCGSETVEVTVNKIINKLPKTDKEKVDEAKPLAETAIAEIIATNTTTAGNILDAVTTGIASVDGVTASWKSAPTITPATQENAGSITGIIVLTCGSETVEVTVNKIINKLPKTDKEKVDEAKPLAETAIAEIIATNTTTAGNILDAVTTGIASVDGVTASWKSAPTITPATQENAGSITGIIVLTCGSETVEVTVNKLIEKLPAPTPDKPTISVGNNGANHQMSSGKDMTFTCSGKLEDLTGVYVDGKLVDASNYTLLSGSTILTLKASYLDTLSAGKHTLKFQYKDNVSAETDFTIIVKEAPKGVPVIKDTASPMSNGSVNSVMYVSIVVLFGCLASTKIGKRKKESNK